MNTIVLGFQGANNAVLAKFERKILDVLDSSENMLQICEKLERVALNVESYCIGAGDSSDAFGRACKSYEKKVKDELICKLMLLEMASQSTTSQMNCLVKDAFQFMKVAVCELMMSKVCHLNMNLKANTETFGDFMENVYFGRPSVKLSFGVIENKIV